MSKYVKYPSYKDSGVEWLGEIPKHWKIKRLASIGSFSKGGGFSKKDLVDKGQSAILYGDIYTRYNIEIKSISRFISDDVAKNVVKINKGDLLFTGSGETVEDIGKCVTYLNEEVICAGGDVIIFSPSSEDSLFLSYALSSDGAILQKSLSAKGQIIIHIYASNLRNLKLTMPPLQEQQTIANYLDVATAKIDTLIEKQTRLIELLREKRQAVISTAVTRGLDNTVAMKDSGVEWLGEIPEHWVIGKIKYYGIYRSGDFISADNIEAEGSYPVLGGNGLRGYAKSYNLKGHYVLIGRQGALCGNINYSNDKFWATEHAIVVHNNKNIDVKWLGEILRTMNLNQYSVSAAQPGLAVDNIINLTGVRPPLEEQQEITNYIDDKTSKIDKLVSKSTKAIDLLKEKRIALISSAVTGKIDVREIA